MAIANGTLGKIPISSAGKFESLCFSFPLPGRKPKKGLSYLKGCFCSLIVLHVAWILIENYDIQKYVRPRN